MASSKNIVAELNKGEKLNGDNYNIWHRKVQHVLEEQETLETLHNTIIEPEKLKSGPTEQYYKDIKAYQSWKRKNNNARIMLLSCMQDDLTCEFEEYSTAHEMWLALKEKYGGSSTTKLRGVNIKFDSFRKCPEKSMRHNLMEMSNMIRELKNAGHVLIDKQQVQAVI